MNYETYVSIIAVGLVASVIIDLVAAFLINRAYRRADKPSLALKERAIGINAKLLSAAAIAGLGINAVFQIFDFQQEVRLTILA